METVLGVLLVLIVCILGHVFSVMWLSSLLGRSAEDIDDRIGEIDQGLGLLAQRLLDPAHWADILAQVGPQQNPLEMILGHFLNQASPEQDYIRDIDGRFHAAQEQTQFIEATTPESNED